MHGLDVIWLVIPKTGSFQRVQTSARSTWMPKYCIFRAQTCDVHGNTTKLEKVNPSSIKILRTKTESNHSCDHTSTHHHGASCPMRRRRARPWHVLSLSRPPRARARAHNASRAMLITRARARAIAHSACRSFSVRARARERCRLRRRDVRLIGRRAQKARAVFANLATTVAAGARAHAARKLMRERAARWMLIERAARLWRWLPRRMAEGWKRGGWRERNSRVLDLSIWIARSLEVWKMCGLLFFFTTHTR